MIDAVVVKEDDLYVAQCLTVDESSFGRTPEQALARLHEAVQIHYEERARRLAVPAEVVGMAQVAL
ncbi:MAG: type II toxin-antitoxin system HicB family antitoxin [Opitutae bacterium]|nr:type II toxin-antitoxin system HicB family antitoxin [Opitutae bacterium]